MDCDKNIWSIHCLTTREDYKNKGIEKILSIAGVELAKKKNATFIEVYPEPRSSIDKEFRTWNIFSGHQLTFEELGFKKINKNFGNQEEFYFPMRLMLK